MAGGGRCYVRAAVDHLGDALGLRHWPLHHGGLLVHGFNVVRQSRRNHRSRPFRYLRWHRAGGRVCVHLRSGRGCSRRYCAGKLAIRERPFCRLMRLKPSSFGRNYCVMRCCNFGRRPLGEDFAAPIRKRLHSPHVSEKQIESRQLVTISAPGIIQTAQENSRWIRGMSPVG